MAAAAFGCGLWYWVPVSGYRRAFRGSSCNCASNSAAVALSAQNFLKLLASMVVALFAVIIGFVCIVDSYGAQVLMGADLL